MRTLSVSTLAQSQSLQFALQRLQAELVKRQTEMSTGQVADLGLALGARTTQALTFGRDFDRLSSIVDSNGLAASRLTATQDALTHLGDSAQKLFATLTSATSGDVSDATLQTSAEATLRSLTSILNTSFNGEHLFAGINTDVEPLSDFTVAGSSAQTGFEAAFQLHFGFAATDPAAADITAAQMDDFLENGLSQEFFGPGWEANWSTASDDGITSRIALNETAETSVSANSQGMRKLAFAAAAIAGLFETNISAAAKSSIIGKATSLVGETIADLANLRADVGVTQQRVSSASDRLNSQIDLFERHIADMRGIDPTEAATRISNLQTQIETAYALTARLQQLSLLNYL